ESLLCVYTGESSYFMRYLGKVRQKLGGIFLLVSLSRLWVKEGLVLVMVFVWVMTHLHNYDFQKYI
ncbi:hypothetical protein CGI85_25335, partial [Vibrio parahaemolyticus]